MAVVTTPLGEGGGYCEAKRMGTHGDRQASALVTLAFDSSYPTGGEAVPAEWATYFPGGILAVFFPGHPTYNFVYDSANSKILVYTRADDVEVANTTDLSALTAIPCQIFGKK